MNTRNFIQKGVSNNLKNNFILPWHVNGVNAETGDQNKPTDDFDYECRFLIALRELIESHLSEPVGIEQLAKKLFLTRVQLYRKVKALTNQSPSRFIRRIRLEKSLTMLKSSDQNIAEIAYKVGFTDPKYFSRVFTEEFGKSPKAYRTIQLQEVKSNIPPPIGNIPPPSARDSIVLLYHPKQTT